jgi:LPXTG-motif cell wall-anchored protein
MNKIRFILLAAILIAVLIPMVVYAQGVWYCDALNEGGGNGTWYDPWGCALKEEFDTIIYEKIGKLYGGGYLYEIHEDGYTVHEIACVNGECEIISSTEFEGYPPNTGVEDLPMPIILAGVALGGAALVLIGLLFRRNKLAN